MVPLAGLEPALLAETDFESVASTCSATGAHTGNVVARNYTNKHVRVNDFRFTEEKTCSHPGQSRRRSHP